MTRPPPRPAPGSAPDSAPGPAPRPIDLSTDRSAPAPAALPDPGELGGLDAVVVQRACDALVAGAADPDAARAVIVKVWALGAGVAEDLLEDLVEVAVSSAGCTGVEPSTSQVLPALGHHEAVGRIREAVEAGRTAHLEAAARVLRVVDLLQERSSVRSVPPAAATSRTSTSTSASSGSPTSSTTSSTGERCAAPASPRRRAVSGSTSTWRT